MHLSSIISVSPLILFVVSLTAPTVVRAQPTAIIDTTAGKLTCTLFPDKAPIGVANFIGLAQGTKDWISPVTHQKKHGVPLYDGTIFHRVIPDFMIQGGDPAGNGTGDPGYQFKNEVSSDLQFDRPGRLAYANAGPDTNGSQFFVISGPDGMRLPPKYSLFGKVVTGLDTVASIDAVGSKSGKPTEQVTIESVTIAEAD